MFNFRDPVTLRAFVIQLIITCRKQEVEQAGKPPQGAEM